MSSPLDPSTACSSNYQGSIQINDPNIVSSKISHLFRNTLLSDVTLVVDGNCYPAHRLILSASSDVFQAMLSNDVWQKDPEICITLQEPSYCIAVFEDFLRFLYTGQLSMNHVTAYPFLCLADKYNVKDLMELCVEYMCSHVVLAARGNQLLNWMEYTSSSGYHKVAQACHTFLKWNFEIVVKTEDFGNLDMEVLEYLLQRNDLVVHDEFALFGYVKKWLHYQTTKFVESGLNETEVECQIQALVVAVVDYIRFPMMAPKQLAELLLCTLTNKYKDIFLERMAIGMSYHKGQMDRVHKVTQNGPNGRLLFTPRIYTAEKWGAPFLLDNFKSIPMYSDRTLLFSSASSSADYQGDNTTEWVIDLYPKGVWFQKYYLIVWHGKMEVPEVVLRTVRLSLTCKELCDPPYVKIGILLMGLQDGIEHVYKVVEKNFLFSKLERVLKFDDILSFDELNDMNNQSRFLVGNLCNTLKIHITIIPLHVIVRGNGNVPTNT